MKEFKFPSGSSSKVTDRDLARMPWDDFVKLRTKTKTVACPTCGAKPGEACAFLPGLAHVMANSHLARYQALSEKENTRD